MSDRLGLEVPDGHFFQTGLKTSRPCAALKKEPNPEQSARPSLEDLHVAMMQSGWLRLWDFFSVPPNATDLVRYAAGTITPDENYKFEMLGEFEEFYAGYQDIQQTRPLQLAVGMTDSPVGFAASIYEFMYNHVDAYPWTPGEIITWAMMYYIQVPYGGFAMCKELTTVSFFDYISQRTTS